MFEISRFYEILGVGPDASLEEVKRAYRDMVKVWHPDRFQHDPRLQIKAQDKLKEINEAYEGIRAYFSSLNESLREDIHVDDINDTEKYYRESFQEDDNKEYNNLYGRPEFRSIPIKEINFKPIAAFLAFNIYSLFLISAFMENTSYLFDSKVISEMRLSGINIDPREWGWGGHYIWCLFSYTLVTALSSFLAGAIAKSKGGKIAVISNIPNLIVWGFLFYLATFGETKIEGQSGFKIVPFIAFPLTTYIAYKSGDLGVKVQKEEFDTKNVFGISPYHLIWLIFPIYWYSLAIIYVTANYASFIFFSSNASLYNGIIGLIILLPVIAWIYPLVLVYKILKGVILSNKRNIIKALANIGILLGGAVLAGSLQFVCYWILKQIL